MSLLSFEMNGDPLSVVAAAGMTASFYHVMVHGMAEDTGIKVPTWFDEDGEAGSPEIGSANLARC